LSLFGTLGAVIVMRGRIRSRNALMEVGAAGPLAGMIVAVPILLIGLILSPVEPLSQGGILEGQSLLYMLLKLVAVGPIPEGYDVYLHPMAWAGWIGLLVTMLNLLPIGQLDGGHISYALWGEAHAKVSRMFIGGIFLLGFCVVGHGVITGLNLGLQGDEFWLHVTTRGNWFFLGALLFWAFGRGKRRYHPPTDDNRLSTGHRIVGLACLVLFAITFTPIPIRILP
jgi:membrane-associated protease RseP (regulator of RpoE activity)